MFKDCFYCSGHTISDADRAAIIARMAVLKQKLAAAAKNLVNNDQSYDDPFEW